MPERLILFATTSRGTEELLANELTRLGAARVRRQRGGVTFSANLYEALRICVWSRIAMRILLPVGEAEVQGSDGLYDAVKAIAWEEHFTETSTFAVEASLRESEHTHSGFVALRIKDAIVDRLREKLGKRPDVDTRNPDIAVVAHLAKQKLSLSLDLCGEPLHRRRYRVATTAAPMKETLAAAILEAAHYTGQEPFFDPMCGSGTLVIEAAMIAANRAPGAERHFAVERWPHHGSQASEILRDVKRDAEGQKRPLEFAFGGSDRDPEAVTAARKNASAAKLPGNLTFSEADVLTMKTCPLGPAFVATNPPYGDRLTAGGQKGMKTFYFKLGESLGRWTDCRLAVLSGNEAFESAFHVRPFRRTEMWNGPIECELLEYAARQRGGASDAKPEESVPE